MSLRKKTLTTAVALGLAFTPGQALAQATNTIGDPVTDPAGTIVPGEDDDGDEGKWGLAGLLGLLGLLGLKRRDRDDRDTVSTNDRR